MNEFMSNNVLKKEELLIGTRRGRFFLRNSLLPPSGLLRNPRPLRGHTHLALFSQVSNFLVEWV